MAEAEANPAVENPSGDAPVVDPSNPVSSLVAGALAKASAADQTPTEPADPASYRGREGTDFRVATTETLVQAQSKERIAELAGVDPNAATREADAIVAAAKAKADAEAAAAAAKAAEEKEEEDAALKIQAVFRGKTARREVETMKSPRGDASDTKKNSTKDDGAGAGVGAFAKGSAALATVPDTASKAMQPAPPAQQLGHWEAFAARQLARHVPMASDGLQTSPTPRGYRFRVLAVEAFPFGPEPFRVVGRGNTLEARCAVSFYDECTGSFHGATCSSTAEAVDVPDANAADESAPVATLDVQHDVYFTTRVCDPRCLIVVEVILVERGGKDGRIVRETSAGWAAMPAVGPGGAEPTGAPGSAPVRQGSPRYLMWGRPRAGQHPPSQLGKAKLHFVHETCAPLLRAGALIPEDFPVTYGDVVPGVLRFDSDGELTGDVSPDVTTTLTSPLLAPTRAVSLKGMKVSLPARMLQVVAASPDLATALHGAGATPPGVDTLMANPTASAAAIAAAKCVTVRVTAHNGRVFVGESVECSDFSVDQNGTPNAIVLEDDAIVPEVPQDVLVVLVCEVLYRAPGKRSDPPVILGWAATCPFRPGIESAGALSDAFSGGLALRIGDDVALTARRGRGPRAEPCVDWRSVVQAPQEVWRAVFRNASGDSGDGGVSVAFTIGAAEGDTGAGSGASQAEAARALLDAPVADNVAQAKSKMAIAETALRDTNVSGRERAKAEAALAAAKMDLSSQQQLVQVMERMQSQLNELASSVNVIKTDLRSSVNVAKPAAVARAPTLDRSPRIAPAAGRIPDDPPPVDLQPLPPAPVYPDEEWPAEGPASGSSALFSGAAVDAGEPLASARGLGGFSRATRARLHAAGADATLPPDVRDALRAAASRAGAPVNPTPDITRERRDIRAVNEVIVQFLAYRKFDALNSSSDLSDVHFTFNFFDFPASTSRPCVLTPRDASRGETQMLVPKGAPARGDGGERAGDAWFRFKVDGHGNGTGDAVPDGPDAMHARRCAFVDYCAGSKLSVDVWDGGSLMQHGTCAVDLTGLLRQGRDSAEVMVEAPVFDHREATIDEASKGRRRRAALAAARGEELPDVDENPGAGMARGALLVRLINVGAKPDRSLIPSAQGGDGAVGNVVRVRAVPESGGVLAATLRGGAQIENTPPGTDAEKATGDNSIASRRAAARADPRDERGVLKEQEARKLSRQQRLREIREGKKPTGHGLEAETSPPAAPEFAESEVRAKLLEDIDAARRRAKRSAVLEKLRSGISGRKVIRPSFGELCFFEHEFKSPADRDCVFEVRCDDPDVSLVASTAEWRALRSASGLPPVAPGMEDDALAGNRLFLLAGESLKVPFKFQSFDAEPSKVINASSSGTAASDIKRGAPDEGLHLRSRAVAVHFVNADDGTSASVLHVDVRPRAMTVARTYRFQTPENDFFKERLPPPPGVDTRDANGRGCLAVRASDPAVAATVVTAESEEDGVAEVDEIALRYKCGEGSVAFYVCVYKDAFLGQLAAVWRVFVHATPKVDVSSLVGQTSHASVVVQGGGSTRRVAAFCSHPDELQVSPDRLTLPPGALTEINLAFRPLIPGRLDVAVHLVDLEKGELVHSRLVATDARGPVVSKTFDVDAAPGTRAHKKITYTNPYPRPRTFNLRCTHPLLLHFRPDKLDLPAGGSRPMGLTFEPAEDWVRAQRGTKGGPAEVLVFINDEDDATEECFRIRVNADPQ